MDKQIKKRKERWMDAIGWMDEWIDRSMDGWIGGNSTYLNSCLRIDVSLIAL